MSSSSGRWRPPGARRSTSSTSDAAAIDSTFRESEISVADLRAFSACAPGRRGSGLPARSSAGAGVRDERGSGRVAQCQRAVVEAVAGRCREGGEVLRFRVASGARHRGRGQVGDAQCTPGARRVGRAVAVAPAVAVAMPALSKIAVTVAVPSHRRDGTLSVVDAGRAPGRADQGRGVSRPSE